MISAQTGVRDDWNWKLTITVSALGGFIILVFTVCGLVLCLRAQKMRALQRARSVSMAEIREVKQINSNIFIGIANNNKM